MKPSRLILGLVYQYLNKELGRTYQEISEFFRMPTRGGVAAGIRDLPRQQQQDKNMTSHEAPPVLLRACVFDIETTNFQGESNADILTCVSFCPLDTSEVTTFAITHEEMMSPDRDKALLIRVIEYLSQFDILIGHNIAAFDLNWLTTRIIYYNLPFPNSVLYYDTYSATKRIGLKTWKNLGSLLAFFGIDAVKTKIMRPDWMNVLHPDVEKFTKAIQETIYHCEQDVIGNKKLFDILWRRDKRLRHIKLYDKWM
jgi:uncharacterized protein YprB with RNaseH-like and TPR domain